MSTNSYTRFNFLQRLRCMCNKDNVTINHTKFVILETLTQGGFSVIDLAENKNTKKKYVIKKVACHSIDDENIALKEVELMKTIKHPNIIELVDFEKHGKADIMHSVISQLYIVLPYYRNGSLMDQLSMRAPRKHYMEPKEIIEIFLGICEGVKAMHEVSPPIAHRDLKPANVVLSDVNEPVILDLGSATYARVQIKGPQQARNLQDLAEERCSICYRPPELFSVESYCLIDERTDIFSLGCVLYAMCYFQSPFDDAFLRGNSVALAVLSSNIDFPSDAPFNSDIKELILFMLRTNPMERPFIYGVIEAAAKVLDKIENRV